MGKGKKLRKGNVSEDEEPDMATVEDGEDKPAAETNGKKGKKDRKKKKEAELEEAERELEAMAAGEEDFSHGVPPEDNSEVKSKKKKKNKRADKNDDDDNDEMESKQGKKGEKTGKAAAKDEDYDDVEVPVVKKSGFAALMDDDNSDVDYMGSSDEAPVIIKAKPEPKQQKKKDKKKKVNKANEDEDEASGDDANEDDNEPEAKKGKKKKDKKKKKTKTAAEEEEDELDRALAELNIASKDTPVEDESAKSAAQKKREKKERQKQKLAEADKTPEEPPKEVVDANEEANDDDSDKKKSKKKGKAEEKKKGKKPGQGTLLAMQEALKKVQEEQEKAKQEEEERIRREEEAENERLEKKRLEEEKKAAKKERERLRKEELRKAGKLLTAKQKEQKARAEQMLEAMRAQGLDVPEAGVKRGPRPGTRVRGSKNKAKSQTPEDTAAAVEEAPVEAEEANVGEEKPDEAKVDEPVDNVKASWDEDDGEKEDVQESWEALDNDDEEAKASVEEKKAADVESEGESEEESEEDSEEDDSEEDESDDEDDDDDDEEDEEEEEHNEAEKRRERALTRISKRKQVNEAKRSTDVLRAPVVVVMGHVDTGKTKILDKLRRTNVQDGEAGGITQQIGATNVPIEVIHEQCKMVTGYDKDTTKVPGLLIIDTPGHESFSNLRDRGSSLCDIAILVVDIMHGLEPQTVESINLLKKKKVPFIIALNKIDRLYEWKSNRHKDVSDVIKGQPSNTRLEFDKRSQEVVTAMAEQGLNAALFYDNPDPKTYISMVPTSAHSGDGMGNLMGLLVKFSQTMLAKRLSFSDELQATVLEVKAIPGLGTTIDIVLVNGTLREGQTMILAGTDGPVVTQVKALLTPAKMQDLRVKNSYIEHKELRAAQGVKIAAKDLEKTVAGLNLLVAHHPDEVEICREEMQKRLENVLSSIKVKDRGVFVQASTLGSLEALLEFLRTSKIPYAGVKIGPVVKKDVMKASVMLEHEEKYTVILAFDVKIERDAQDMADSLGVKIFQADIIYHLFDRFTSYQEELKRQKREEFKHVAVFPCKFKVLPNFVFNSRDPIVAGVVVEAGVVRQGTPICVPSKTFLEIGIVTSIESNHKEVETARKGEEICVKIEPIPGESPKMFGRHFDETDVLVSKISRASIDACKDYFRDDLQKSDWQLMVELKKLFEIM